jgi:hypothetical protein
MNGGDDGTRTRGLCRDSGIRVLSTTWKSTDGTVSHWKYIIGNVIVYRDVYRLRSPIGKEAEAKQAEAVSARLRKRRSRNRAGYD